MTARLRKGDVVRYEGALWRVALVNECRARLDCLSRERVSYRDADGEPVEFEARRSRSANVSPCADLERVSPDEAEGAPPEGVPEGIEER